jgi:hypothetical protein
MKFTDQPTMRPVLFVLCLAALFNLTNRPAIAQQPSKTPPDDVVRINTDLVQTAVTVVDKDGRFVEGLDRSQFELTVPISLAAWSQPFALTSGNAIFSYATSCGNTVHAAMSSDDILYYRRSTNEGASWLDTFSQIGTGELYLERPVACGGSTVVVASHAVTRTVTDWCCPRNLGTLLVYVSTDNGQTFREPVEMGIDSYRVAAAIKGSQIVISWMQYKDAINAWDLMFRESVDGGISWLPARVVAAGTTTAGHARPDILIDGTTVIVSWMKSVPTSCGAIVQCASLQIARRLNGMWQPRQQITVDGVYAGRPSMASTGNALVTTFDTQVNGKDEVGLVRSTDRGVTWSAPVIWARSGLDGHAMIISGLTPGQFLVAWMGAKNGVGQYTYFRSSLDSGLTWRPEELVFTNEADVPAISQTTNYLHVVTTSPRYGPVQYSRRAWGSAPSPTPTPSPTPSVTPTPGLQTLAPGKYELRVTIGDTLAGTSVTRGTDFEVR